MLHQFSETIARIYAAASDATLWTNAFAAIEELTGCEGAVVTLVPNDSAVEGLTLFGPRILEHGSADEVGEYDRELLPICPRVAAGVANPNAHYLCDYMIMTESEMARDPVYDWYRNHGLDYFIGSSLTDVGPYRAMWSLQRTRSQGHVQDADINVFLLLKPHIGRALNIADQLGTLRSFNSFTSAVLQTLPQAIFALDQHGRVLFANAAGEALLRDADGLCCTNAGLRTGNAAEQGRLDTLIREAAYLDLNGAGGWARVSRSAGGPPYAAFIVSLNPLEEELIEAKAKVLVIVHDTGLQSAADPLMLAQVFNLTHAEAGLASALSVGHSIESAAALLNIKPATARSELKSVFRKIGVSRQQDLVRVLTSLSSISA